MEHEAAHAPELGAAGAEDTVTAKAISIRSPWWWAILYAGKRLENRSWYCGYRGPILLDASRWFEYDEIRGLLEDTILPMAADAGLTPPPVTMHDFKERFAGGIVGRARIVGCRRNEGADPWEVPGEWGIVLADVEPLPFRATRGALGLFEVADQRCKPEAHGIPKKEHEAGGSGGRGLAAAPVDRCEGQAADSPPGDASASRAHVGSGEA